MSGLTGDGFRKIDAMNLGMGRHASLLEWKPAGIGKAWK